MKRNKVSGFTLIELLVVITIIGILAVGGVSVYTSQMAKARDSNRVRDVKAIQAALESIAGSNGQSYPSNVEISTGGTFALKNFMKVPSDPKTGDDCDMRTGGTQITPCDYLYIRGTLTQNGNSIANGAYEISAGFENNTNSMLTSDYDTTSANDDSYRFEVGNQDLNTTIARKGSSTTFKAGGTIAGNSICDGNNNVSNGGNGIFLISSNCNN